MRLSIKKIGLLIVAVVLIPVMVFSVFEIGNLRQQERIIQDIYQNQLDAILFSINQYSDDILSNLASRIENALNNYNPDNESELQKLIYEFPSVKGLVQLNKNFKYLSTVRHNSEDSSFLSDNEIVTTLNNSDTALLRLQNYMRGGYRKIEAIGKATGSMQLIVFITRVQQEDVYNVLVIDPEEFIQQFLDPKIQEVSQDKFDIVAFRRGEDIAFYNSNKQNNAQRTYEKKPFWLLADYLIGIELKDLTIADLARTRIKRNIFLITLVDMILLLGAWMIYRNVKRQVEFSQLKSDFVSNVSHEIRTPLALISLNIETLEMGRVNDPQKIAEYYSVILNETNRLSGIVNRILSFSQIESNKRKYCFSTININNIVEHTLMNMKYSIVSKGFDLSFEPDKNLPKVQGDREAISEALMNLVDNAIKYSASEKEITIRTGNKDHYVYIEVEDKGVGISEREQKYIFDKFYRVTQKNLAHKIKGSGLGLSIVKHIMDAHKGKIHIRSAVGSGSLFRLMFSVN